MLSYALSHLVLVESTHLKPWQVRVCKILQLFFAFRAITFPSSEPGKVRKRKGAAEANIHVHSEHWLAGNVKAATLFTNAIPSTMHILCQAHAGISANICE